METLHSSDDSVEPCVHVDVDGNDDVVDPDVVKEIIALRPVQRRGLDTAIHRLREESGHVSLGLPPRIVGTCGVMVTHGPWAGQRCKNPAGLNTPNAGDEEEPGVGPCWAHGGAKFRGRAEAGWIMAHRFAQELNVTPWEGLLKAVRIAAGKVAYTEWVIGQATDDLELEGRFGHDDNGILIHPDTGAPLGAGQLRNRSWWVHKNELWVDRLARYSKAAIDAGVAERLVEIEQTHAEHVARVLNGVLTALEQDTHIDELMLARMRGIMRQQLLALDASANGQVMEGEVV